MKLQDKYNSIKDELKTELGLENSMQIPRLTKIVINVGTKEAVIDKKVLDKIVEQIGKIAGQKPVITKAKKDISSFKLRRGMPIGVMVSLRGERMWSFLEKLINIVCPKVRDFRGLKKDSFDGFGNYSFGFREQIIFPEIEYSEIDKIRGMQINIGTTGGSNKNGLKLLEKLGFPFKK
jgi:large subunit ribosomal protein L5